MAFPLDTSSITHGIQLAVAPVFLLTAVSGMIGAVAVRLGRIIDRGRKLEESADQLTDPAHRERVAQELRSLRVRGRLSNGCIGLLTTCAFLIGVTIILLFLGEAASLRTSQYAIAGFLLGVVSFLLALLCFMGETLIATRVLNFRITEVAGPAHGEPSRRSH